MIKHILLRLLSTTSKLWPAKWYILIRYALETNDGFLNLSSPQTFNEKLNWLKLNDRNPLYTRLADKYEVKDVVAKIIGEKYIVPCYGIYNSVEEIELSSLPKQFVIKSNHDSSGVFIVRDKNKLSLEDLKKRYNRTLKNNHYWLYREWPYKNITPKILIEKYLDDHSGSELTDYKFWCFNGIPKVMYCTNKSKDIFENFYDMNFKPLDINHGFRRKYPEFVQPHAFELMKELAAKLSQNIPFVRVDFFDVDGNVYFGEFTFYDWGGFRAFKNRSWDKVLGSWIEL